MRCLPGSFLVVFPRAIGFFKGRVVVNINSVVVVVDFAAPLAARFLGAVAWTGSASELFPCVSVSRVVVVLTARFGLLVVEVEGAAAAAFFLGGIAIILY